MVHKTRIVLWLMLGKHEIKLGESDLYPRSVRALDVNLYWESLRRRKRALS